MPRLGPTRRRSLAALLLGGLLLVLARTATDRAPRGSSRGGTTVARGEARGSRAIGTEAPFGPVASARERGRAHARRVLPVAAPRAPERAEMQHALAELALTQERDEDARRAATECLGAAPEHPGCTIALAMSLMRQGELDQAAPHLARCLERDPEQIHCLSGMLTIELRRDHSREVIALAARLRRLEPDGLWTHLADALIAERAGHRDEAVAQFGVACERGQPFACTRLAALGSPDATL